MRVQTFGSATLALIFSLSLSIGSTELLLGPPGLNQTLASRLSIGGMSVQKSRLLRTAKMTLE
jgi:hypothetical protein